MISRRSFLQCLTAAAVLYPASRAFGSICPDRSLELYNIHTDESLEVTYCVGGRYDADALEQINYLMRCHYTNEVKTIDPGVLDLLCDIRDRVGGNGPVEIISAYRSPEYNAYLRSRSRKVARDSYHLQGLAIDFSISGVRKTVLARAARSLLAGGVGKYRQFVHIDTGPVRHW